VVLWFSQNSANIFYFLKIYFAGVGPKHGIHTVSKDKSLSQTNGDGRLLSVPEAARRLGGIHPQTIYKWVKQGKLPFVSFGRSVRFDPIALDAFITSSSFSPEPVPVDISTIDTLSGYDKRFLRRKTTVNGVTRFTYKRTGSVILRKTKEGGERFYIDFQVNGKRVREVVKLARTRADAVNALNAKADTFRQASGFKLELPKLTFAEMGKLYLEKYALNKRSLKSTDVPFLKSLCKSFGPLKLRDVTPEKIEVYRSQRLAAGLKPCSVNRQASCLRKVFNVAIAWGYTAENPVKKIRFFSEKENIRERVLSPVEEVKLLESCSGYLRSMVFLALHSGMRRGEIFQLRWEDVDLEAAALRVIRSKSGKPRVISINSELLSELRTSRSAAGADEFVFLNPATGRPYVDVKRAFHVACTAAGIVGLRFHDLRHTFATRLVKRGVDLILVKELMGHSSVVTTERYTHSQAAEKLRAVERLCEKPPQSENLCQTGGKPESGEAVAVPPNDSLLVS
jgi:excisionase family DNA binding protein